MVISAPGVDSSIAGGGSSIAPVRSLRPNPWGLYDVHGNVVEWCLGINKDRSAQTVDAEQDDDEHAGNAGLIRGGSFTMDASLARSGALPYVGRDSENSDIGFRFIIEGDTLPTPAQ